MRLCCVRRDVDAFGWKPKELENSCACVNVSIISVAPSGYSIEWNVLKESISTNIAN